MLPRRGRYKPGLGDTCTGAAPRLVCDVPELVQEKGDRRAISIIAHPVYKCDAVCPIEDEVATELKHIGGKAQKALSPEQELQIAQIEFGGQHGAEQARPPEAPAPVRGALGVKDDWERDVEAPHHLRPEKTRTVIGNEDHDAADRCDLPLLLNHLDQVNAAEGSGGVTEKRDQDGSPSHIGQRKVGSCLSRESQTRSRITDPRSHTTCFHWQPPWLLSLAPNDLRISCRPSGPSRHKPTPPLSGHAERGSRHAVPAHFGPSAACAG